MLLLSHRDGAKEMIATLRGQLISKGKDFVVVEVSGVGFRVTVSQRLVNIWQEPGQEVEIYTHLHVRENELALYGCSTEEELALFRLLMTVSGVGPKVAMSILSELSPGTLRLAIAREDVETLAHVPGIGPKTAKKIAFHLKDKITVEEILPLAPTERKAWESEVIATLTALGYTLAEAHAAVASLPSREMEFEERLRLALRYFAR